MGEMRSPDAGCAGKRVVPLAPGFSPVGGRGKLQERNRLHKPKRILVVKLSDIGDVLTATPALRALRRSFPEARLDALVPPNSAPVLAGSPLVDSRLVFDKFRYDRLLDALHPSALSDAPRLGLKLRRRGYDCLILLHHLTTRWGALKFAALALASGAGMRLGLDNGRGWFLTHRARDMGFGARHEVEYWLEVVALIGARTDDLSLEVTISPEDEAFADAVIPAAPLLVAIHPGSGGYSLARRWDAEGFARVAEALMERYEARIVLVGTSADGVSKVASLMRPVKLPKSPRLRKFYTNLEGRTTLGQLAAVLKRCDLFIGADSGVMHLACAVGTPVVAIFGPSNHRAWGPWTPGRRRAVVVRADLPCSPCSYVGFSVGRREGCEARTCMKMVTPEMVLEAATELLGG